MEVNYPDIERINARIKEEGRIEKDTFTGYVGIELDEIRPGYCRAHLDIKDYHLNPMGSLHGGAAFTLMDVAAGYSGVYANGNHRGLVTQCADIHFLRPITEGRATAESNVIKSGRNTAYSEVKVMNEKSEICLCADFEMFYTS